MATTERTLGHRLHVPFEALWQMRIATPYSLMVRDGDLAWSCGQCPFRQDGTVVAPGDLVAQTECVAGYIDVLLGHAGLEAAALGKLILYHTASDEPTLAQAVDVLRRHFGPRPIIFPVGIPHFYYEGMMLEVDAFAGREGGRTIAFGDRSAGIAGQVVDGGPMAWAALEIDGSAGASPAALAHAIAAPLDQALAEIGLARRDLLAEHWFVTEDTSAAPAIDAAAQAGLLADRGAVASLCRGSDSLLRAELTFAVSGAVSGHGSGPVSKAAEAEGVILRFRRHGPSFWAAGRCATPRGSLVEETAAIMRALDMLLAAESLGFAAVTKATVHYAGGDTEAALHDNMTVRNAYYRRPGPASTGVPVPGFPYAQSKITIDVLGTAAPVPAP